MKKMNNELFDQKFNESLDYLKSREDITILKTSKRSIWTEYKGLKVKFYFQAVERSINSITKYDAVTVQTFCNTKYASNREICVVETCIEKILYFDLRAWL